MLHSQEPLQRKDKEHLNLRSARKGSQAQNFPDSQPEIHGLVFQDLFHLKVIYWSCYYPTIRKGYSKMGVGQSSQKTASTELQSSAIIPQMLLANSYQCCAIDLQIYRLFPASMMESGFRWMLEARISGWEKQSQKEGKGELKKIMNNGIKLSFSSRKAKDHRHLYNVNCTTPHSVKQTAKFS